MIPAWLRCLERLEAEFPAEEVHTWLKPLQAEAGDDGLCLFAPNAFVVETVRDRYLDRICALVSHLAGSETAVHRQVGAMRSDEQRVRKGIGVTGWTR